MDMNTPSVPPNDTDAIVDELLRKYYRVFLEEDGVVEPLLSTLLDAIPVGKKPGKDR